VSWERPDWYCQEILNGRTAVSHVYENDHALAFHAPNRGRNQSVHVLVIPKQHVETLLDLGPDDATLVMALLDAVQGTARALRLDQSGFYLRINCLPPYQHTGHLHWHVIVKAPKQPALPIAGAGEGQ
jgi:histidine triad (HIT) family protein